MEPSWRSNTMRWQPCGCNLMITDRTSQAFELLHPKVQRWIYWQGWTELRDIQEKAVSSILANGDVILAASTASGKTEAAFLPIASSFASASDKQGLVLYLSPLKALINDQYRRLAPFFEPLGLSVWPWHGDVASSIKQRFLQDGSGVLLITPESLEGLFVREGFSVPHLFRHLKYVVIDEAHLFIASERGKQLQSVLHRLETALGRSVPRIGLSATLGDMNLAAEYLRPTDAASVHIIESKATGQMLKLAVHGYRQTTEWEQPQGSATEAESETEHCATKKRIAEDLFKVIRTGNHLIFANNRADAEVYADFLHTRCQEEQIPAQCFAHHGSLSKDLREQAEETLKADSRPTTVVCTSTLELGIDIGQVESVGQIGSPFSVASLRQRLGRSGRRGEPAILRVYVPEVAVTAETSPVDAIHAKLIQSVALVRLLLARWSEPPVSDRLHLSTLVHQVLSLIAECGGVRALDAWNVLCRNGAFRNVSRAQFVEVLRAMSAAKLVMQVADGTLLHALVGERVVNRYDFGTVFQTPDEYRLITDAGKSLGSLPIEQSLREETLIIFAGRRWRVVLVDGRQKVIQVTPAIGGNVPRFTGSGGQVHDRVREEMRSVYLDEVLPVYLDREASELLSEGREYFFALELDKQRIVSHRGTTYMFPWVGDRIMNTITVQLQSVGIAAQNVGIAIEFEALDPASVRREIRRLANCGPANAVELAGAVANKETEKFHPFLTESLLCADYASSNLDTVGAWRALASLESS